MPLLDADSRSQLEAASGIIWINDDNDASMVPGDAGEDVVGGNAKDFVRNVPGCLRDLEDFSRLRISTQGLNAAFKNGDMFLGLKWEVSSGAPAIKVFPAVETDGGTAYLTDGSSGGAAERQSQKYALIDERFVGEDPNNSTHTTVGGTDVFVLPKSLFENLSESQQRTCLLFEGCSVGKGQLKLVILDKNKQVIGEGPGIWFDFKNIKSMYQGPGTTFDQPVNETPQGIIFVHGWNMSTEGSVNFAETMFKRLWHRGFKGRFVSLRWNTNYSDAFDAVPLIGEAVEGYLANYNGSERIAWQSGTLVKAAVDGLPSGYSRNIVAHSMGNIVVGSALLAGVAFDNYVLMQAAVPASCYDSRELLKQVERPAPQTYAGFRPTFWEAECSPDDDPVSETRALSYRGRLSASAGNMISFYLSEDHATTYAWEFNNDQTKPVDGYGYSRGAPTMFDTQQALWRLVGMGPTAHHVPLTDPLVAMPFVCRSWSKVVGAESRTAGVIQGSLNLSSETFSLPGGTGGFRDEHSAQFNRSFQFLTPFYDELLRRLGIAPTP